MNRADTKKKPGIYRMALELELKKAQDIFDKISGEAMDVLDRMQESGEVNLSTEHSDIIDRVLEASDRVSEVRRRIHQYEINVA